MGRLPCACLPCGPSHALEPRLLCSSCHLAQHSTPSHPCLQTTHQAVLLQLQESWSRPYQVCACVGAACLCHPTLLSQSTGS